MESVDSTSRVIPLTVSFHFDRWRVSLKKRPSGSSGLTSISPLRLETRNVEPSRVLMLSPLIGTSPQLRPRLFNADSDGDGEREHECCNQRAKRIDSAKRKTDKFP